MRIITGRRRVVLVTGLPRSGTTLLCSILNSADNACFLSEPHNALRTYGHFFPDKATPNTPYLTLPLDRVIPWLSDLPFEVVGMKEVLESLDPDNPFQYLPDYAIPSADLILVTLRDPVETYRSQKHTLQMGIGSALCWLFRFRVWIRRLQKLGKDLRFIHYEDLVENPERTLGMESLGNDFYLEGPVVKKRMRGFGDNRALHSTEIRKFEIRCPITDAEILAIREVAKEAFEGLE